MRSDVIGILFVLLATSGGCGQSNYPTFCAVTVDDSPVRGSDDAWVTIVVFSDFQCPYCGNAATTLGQLADEYTTDQLRIVFKHLPLDFHEHAYAAAIAAECAHEQGLFWDMHDLLFAHQSALDETSLVSYAQDASLDETAWSDCRESQGPRDLVEADRQLAANAKVPATPTLFINGSPFIGSYPLEDLRDAVDEALSEALDSGHSQGEYYESLTQIACE